MQRSEQIRNRKPYQTPKLEVYGNLQELTLHIKGGPGRDGGSPPFHKRGKKSK